MVWDSALMILMAEALVVILLAAVAVFFRSRKRHSNEMGEVERFIGRLEVEENLKTKMLETILVENCGFDKQSIAQTLQEVSASERALLQRVIQLFLQRDPTLLSEVDQLIANLSDPYCKLLAGNNGGAAAVSPASSEEEDRRLEGLERINQQLVKQLDAAMKTIDEITEEYTRVFSGHQTALELENSSKKMLQIFQEAEQRIKCQMED